MNNQLTKDVDLKALQEAIEHLKQYSFQHIQIFAEYINDNGDTVTTHDGTGSLNARMGFCEQWLSKQNFLMEQEWLNG